LVGGGSAMVQVTESPWATVTVAGLKAKPEMVTPWLAARAGQAAPHGAARRTARAIRRMGSLSSVAGPKGRTPRDWNHDLRTFANAL
jgi:hypothetical protein